jgi:hypothetical protein
VPSRLHVVATASLAVVLASALTIAGDVVAHQQRMYFHAGRLAAGHR